MVAFQLQLPGKEKYYLKYTVEAYKIYEAFPEPSGKSGPVCGTSNGLHAYFYQRNTLELCVVRNVQFLKDSSSVK